MLINKDNWRVRADRWPWQTRKSAAMLSGPQEQAGMKYGWKPTDGMGRFGGGWQYRLGIDFSKREGSFSVMVCLLFGFVSVGYNRKGIKK